MIPKAISDALDKYAGLVAEDARGSSIESSDDARAALERAIAEHVAEQVRWTDFDRAELDRLHTFVQKELRVRMGEEHVEPVAALEDPEPGIDDMLAWLHKRGEHGAQVLVSSMNGECNCELVLADYSEEMGSKFYFGPSDATSTGSNLTEALQRLVVAVAKRGSGGRT